MYKGFVINLGRRRDRLNAFTANNSALTGFVDVEPYPAVDGQSLPLEGSLRNRINPWNFRHLSDKKLRGVVGCALSHIGLWERISKMDDKFVFVFEDDARLIRSDLARTLQRLCKTLPENANLVWLTDWSRDASKTERIKTKLRSVSAPLFNPALVRWPAITEKTAEAYIITPKFAATLHSAIKDNIGAIDEHIRSFIASRPDLACFCASPPIFTQANRSDTDVQAA